MNLLIDGDILVYQMARAVETHIEWPSDIITVSADGKEAARLVDQAIMELRETIGAEEVTVAITHNSAEVFRREVWDGYKQNRTPGSRPVAYHKIRNHLLEAHNALSWPSIEADDTLALLATSGRFVDPVIVSIDKDFKTVPGKMLNPDKLQNGIEEFSEVEARRNFMIQVLEGDRADGYPGCPGYGPVLARRSLADLDTPTEMWKAVVAAYEKKDLTEEDAIRNARMAWLLQGDDYNIKTKDVTLWNPKRI